MERGNFYLVNQIPVFVLDGNRVLYFNYLNAGPKYITIDTRFKNNIVPYDQKDFLKRFMNVEDVRLGIFDCVFKEIKYGI